MSIKGKTVWALRSGIHYEGSTLVGVYETLDGACLAAQEFMERENEKDRKIGGTDQEWKYEEVDDSRFWDGECFWLLVKPYEIQ